MEIQKDTTANPVPKENFLKEIVKFTLIAIAIVIPIRAYVAQPFIVSGASMDPTFKSGQYLIVDQLTYHFNEPQREDVIVFRYPHDPSIFYIKRIIGLPGETVTMTDGKIKITSKEHPEGLVMDDPHVIPAHRTSDNYTITLRDTEYFVMGDNRPESSDSRVWGPLERKYITGRPILRLFPHGSASIFPGR
jgi:signal peptidase I